MAVVLCLEMEAATPREPRNCYSAMLLCLRLACGWTGHGEGPRGAFLRVAERAEATRL